MKNILLLVHEDEGDEARLQVALDVTRATTGHLTCLSIAAGPQDLSSSNLGCVEAVMLEEARERQSLFEVRLRERLANEDVAWTIIEVTGDPAEKLRKEARWADLVVLSSNAGQKDRAGAGRMAAELVVKSGRPVLAVPSKAAGLDVRGGVLVAWNGSDEAEAALRAAIPLLQLSRQVTLIEVNLPGGALAAEDAARYLSRYGVRVEILPRTSDGAVSEMILADARRLRPSFIVMGAYGLGRTLDTLLGGVSGSMLRNSEFPLFLSH